jgi:hypothetical protein
MSDASKRRAIDSTHIRAGFETLIFESKETLKRYSPEQIAKSKILSRRKSRLEFYELCIKDFDYRFGNNVRKAKRKTYLLGMVCTCGYLVRVTQKWLDVAAPTCPNPDCPSMGKPMQEIGSLPADPRGEQERQQQAAEILEEFRAEFEQERASDSKIGTDEDRPACCKADKGAICEYPICDCERGSL